MTIFLSELYKMRVSELRNLARELGIAGRTDMNRAQLIQAMEIPLLERRVHRLEGLVEVLVGEALQEPPPGQNPFEKLKEAV